MSNHFFGALSGAIAMALLIPQAGAGATPPAGDGTWGGQSTNQSANVNVREEVRDPGSPSNAPIGVPVAQQEDPYEYRTTLGCGNKLNPDANNDPTNCTYGMTVCSTAADPGGILYYSWIRRRGTAGTPWRFWGESCSSAALPPAAVPPAIPSMVQIREAFASLPFGRPTVAVEPVGGKTLVNLPTFFEIQWDGSGLEPGSVSAPVQLLSWSVEFEVATQSYTVDFGDGLTSGATTDRGGPYPSGNIRHTYVQPLPAAAVKADTVLTGRFRVNGGAWQDLGGVADLQNEPVTTLEVLEARARLVT